MNQQVQLAVLFVKELQKQKVTEDIICQYGIETLRVCKSCGQLMNEGWIYQGIETYCCDECLLNAHPDENLTELNKLASEDDTDTYWTQWEG